MIIKRTVAYLLLCLVGGMIVISSVSAEVVPTPGTLNVQNLFSRSDVVCICLIQAISPVGSEPAEAGGGPAPQTAYSATATADQLMKAKPSTPTSLIVTYQGNRLSKGKTYLLFLRSDGGLTFTMADPYVGSTLFNRLPIGSGSSGWERLESSLAEAAKGKDHDDQTNAMRLLQGFPQVSQPVISGLISLTDSADPDIAFGAFGVLLKSGKSLYVFRLAKYLRKHSFQTAPISILSIGSELSQVQDNEALPALGDLSASSIISVQMGSMQALRALRNPEAAPFVVKRLEDSNAIIRYLAVMTLAETFDKYGEYAPNMSLFDRNPEYYCNLWKSWWITEGQALQPQAEKR